MTAAFDWLNQNNGAAIALLTIVLTAFNGAVVWLGFRRLKTSLEPNLIAFAQPDTANHGLVQLVIANIGQGVARKIMISTSLPDSLTDSVTVRIPGLNGVSSISALLSGEKVTFALGFGWDLLAQEQLRNFGLTLQYEGPWLRSGRQDRFNISIEEWEGFGWLGNSPEHDSAKRLAEISKTLKEGMKILRRVKF